MEAIRKRVCHFPRLNEAEREAVKEYYRRLKESDGFDIAGLRAPKGVVPLKECSLSCFNACVKLYARMGLHRYNMLFGKNLELSAIQRYNRLRNTPSYFCITLDAYDRAICEKVGFQVKVYEERIYLLHVTCTIARREVDDKISSTRNPSTCHLYHGNLPDWPSSEDVFSDTGRFYVVKDSELQEHTWIHLYLELAFANKTDTTIYKHLSYLHIVKAVIETKDPLESPEERLKAKHATVYISFLNMSKPNMRRKPTFCKVIVTRDFDETTEDLILRSSGWAEEEADETIVDLMRSSNACPEEETSDTNPDECRQGGIEESVNEHNEFEEVGPMRRSTRKRMPIQRYLG